MRHGPALQGNLEGKPGRGPEVHHQGSDNAVALLLAAALILLTSCAGPSGGADSAPEAPPREGTILYHEPGSSEPGSRKIKGLAARSAGPLTQVFTTPKGEVKPEEDLQAFSGTVQGVSPGRDVDPRQWERAVERMMRATQAGSKRVLTVERFAELWRGLAAAGLFQLPLHRAQDPPRGEPYFLVTAGERTWIFPRPSGSRAGQGAEPDLVRSRLKTWIKAKVIFFDFVNQP